MSSESLLATVILLIALIIFVFMFLVMALSFIRWFRFPAYQPPAIKVEDYSCPKCGSKDLKLIGRRTLRCKKCGTTFTIQPATVETRFIIWPIPVEK